MRCLLGCLILSAVIPLLVQAPSKEESVQPPVSAASSEMDRLAKALAGNWNTAESMEKSVFFPKGGARRGRAHVWLTAGGTTLIDEVHSDGSAGKLDGLLVIWWDDTAKLYRLLTCFNSPKNPCKIRGTAHWKGDTFVNDYEEVVNGKLSKCRDSFIHITPTSHSLVAAMDAGDGTMKTLITTTSTRR
jgi:hypothetical protein